MSSSDRLRGSVRLSARYPGYQRGVNGISEVPGVSARYPGYQYAMVCTGISEVPAGKEGPTLLKHESEEEKPVVFSDLKDFTFGAGLDFTTTSSDKKSKSFPDGKSETGDKEEESDTSDEEEEESETGDEEEEEEKEESETDEEQKKQTEEDIAELYKQAKAKMQASDYDGALVFLEEICDPSELHLQQMCICYVQMLNDLSKEDLQDLIDYATQIIERCSDPSALGDRKRLARLVKALYYRAKAYAGMDALANRKFDQQAGEKRENVVKRKKQVLTQKLLSKTKKQLYQEGLRQQFMTTTVDPLQRLTTCAQSHNKGKHAPGSVLEEVEEDDDDNEHQDEEVLEEEEGEEEGTIERYRCAAVSSTNRQRDYGDDVVVEKTPPVDLLARQDLDHALQIDAKFLDKEFDFLLRSELKTLNKAISQRERATKTGFYKATETKRKEERRKANFCRSFNTHALKH